MIENAGAVLTITLLFTISIISFFLGLSFLRKGFGFKRPLLRFLSCIIMISVAGMSTMTGIALMGMFD